MLYSVGEPGYSGAGAHPPEGEMAQSGARFETYVRDAMRDAGIPSIAELARRSGIAASQWHGWFRGDRNPRRNTLRLAESSLKRTAEQMRAVWVGERPAKALRSSDADPVSAAHAEQTALLREILALLRNPAAVGPIVEGTRRGEERLADQDPPLPAQPPERPPHGSGAVPRRQRRPRRGSPGP